MAARSGPEVESQKEASETKSQEAVSEQGKAAVVAATGMAGIVPSTEETGEKSPSNPLGYYIVTETRAQKELRRSSVRRRVRRRMSGKRGARGDERYMLGRPKGITAGNIILHSCTLRPRGLALLSIKPRSVLSKKARIYQRRGRANGHPWVLRKSLDS